MMIRQDTMTQVPWAAACSSQTVIILSTSRYYRRYHILGWDTQAPYYQGQFGFAIRNSWQDTSNRSLVIGGNATDYEIEYVEAGEGGFAGMVFKTDSGSVDMQNVSL
jgi:hypothetical protein